MSRGLIQYSRNIFNLLSDGLSVSNIDNMKILKNKNKSAFCEELKIFRNASRLEVDYILHNVKIGRFLYENIEYLVLTQINKTNPSYEEISRHLESLGIVEQEVNAGLFLVIATEANLQRISPLDLRELDEIFFDEYDENYQGHDFYDLIKFIEIFAIFKIDANSIYSGRNYIETGYFICSQFQEFIKLPMQPLISDYISMLQEDSPVLKENIFLSLTATHYKHAFIELYRCIEVLYVMPRSIMLKNKLSYSNPAYELARHCIDELGWRKREEDSLCRIFKDIDEKIIETSGIQSVSFAENSWSFDGTDDQKKSHEALAIKIYRIRNQLVHQLYPNNELKIMDSDWNPLIKLLLNVTKDAYRVYQAELPQKFS
ncbi:hypothetical protein PL263_19685 [Methylomonas sp. EFPC3]|uniref:hypothetical protein n=1 Tax=Methylomonas sp. EFPC3 TaxID=3021710 RepID=UPI002415E807|nr:hypothetical protein [Methylomonas sp. EFPC3]WFP50300.1 hypothetical protein PL263_19685 [Methylomonas sp. EFPC3]